jgi:hypothetical protein
LELAMPIYKFEAVDRTGAEVRDSIVTHSVSEAQRLIQQMGYFVTRITEVADGKNKWLTTVTGPFRFLKRFFNKPVAQSPPREEAGDGRSAPESAPVRRAAPDGRQIGQVLVELGFLDEGQLWAVLDEAKNTGNPTGRVAVARGLITEDRLIQALGELHSLQVVDLREVKPSPEAMALVPEIMATVYKVLPLSIKDLVLTVATSDPTRLTALDDLRRLISVKGVRPMLASPRAIEEMIVAAYREKEEGIADTRAG